jgi:glyoxylase-like metal-dependent hydrolase (beta-lactamase superfamily II)
MRAAGLDPAAVRAVIVKHFHGDHITGLTTAQNGSGDSQAENRRARRRMGPGSPTPATRRARPEGQRRHLQQRSRRFAPYQGKVRQVADGAEVVRASAPSPPMATRRATPSIHVADGNAQMMFLADLTNRPELFARRPDFQAVSTSTATWPPPPAAASSTAPLPIACW